jgi:hypothetical protein
MCSLIPCQQLYALHLGMEGVMFSDLSLTLYGCGVMFSDLSLTLYGCVILYIFNILKGFLFSCPWFVSCTQFSPAA